MNMKLTKKDKIMLLVLGVIIIVAVFYMYGIKPAKEKNAELDGIVATKQTAVTDLQARLAALAGAQIDHKFDTALDFYFENNEDTSLHPLIDKIAIEMMMRDLFDEYKLVGYSTVGWSTLPNEYTNTYDEIVATNSYYVGSISISYKIEKEADFRKLIDRFNTDPNFRLVNYTMKEEEKPAEPEPDPGAPPTPPTPDPGTPPTPPEKFYELTGTMNIEFYMGDKYRSEILPKKLPSPVLSANGGEITFAEVEGAVSYEVYNVTEDNAGKKVYTLLPKVQPVQKDGNMLVTIGATDIPTQTANIAVRAIGDKKAYYKTKLVDMVPVAVTVA